MTMKYRVFKVWRSFIYKTFIMMPAIFFSLYDLCIATNVAIITSNLNVLSVESKCLAPQFCGQEVPI
jgi:hypothetical protein